MCGRRNIQHFCVKSIRNGLDIPLIVAVEIFNIAQKRSTIIFESPSRRLIEPKPSSERGNKSNGERLSETGENVAGWARVTDYRECLV